MSIIKRNIFIILFVIIILGFVATPMIISSYHVEYHTITVEEKGVKHYDDDDTYLIYTDNGVYSVEDEILRLHFNASDVYSELKVGETYTVKTTGFRIHILSVYKNIIEIKEE